MMKKIFAVFLIIALSFTAAGCSGVLRKKFTRKKDAEKKITPVFRPYDYKTELTSKQLYVNHYTFWKNAQAEVIKILGENTINNKRLKTYSRYALDEIKQMQQFLPQEQKEKLGPYIEDLSSIVFNLWDENYVAGHRHTLTKALKHNYNEVSKNFSYVKMKGLLEG